MITPLKIKLMKTLIVILFAAISTMANSQIRKDKTLHFGAGILVGGITAFVSERAGISDNKFKTIILSTSVSTVVGVGKEVYDLYVKRTFVDNKDILWTAIGGLVGGVSVTYTIRPRDKQKRPTFTI